MEVLTIATKELLVNEAIKFKEVRVIDSDGSQLGVMSSDKALDAAYAKDLDLVAISPNATPPVCKIMDYGKYRFEKAKKENAVIEQIIEPQGVVIIVFSFKDIESLENFCKEISE